MNVKPLKSIAISSFVFLMEKQMHDKRILKHKWNSYVSFVKRFLRLKRFPKLKFDDDVQKLLLKESEDFLLVAVCFHDFIALSRVSPFHE